MNRRIDLFDIAALFRSRRLQIVTASGVIAWFLYSYWMQYVDFPPRFSLNGNGQFWPLSVSGDLPREDRIFWIWLVERTNFCVKAWSVGSFAWFCQYAYGRKLYQVKMNTLLAATSVAAVVFAIIGYSDVVYQAPGFVTARKIEFRIHWLPLWCLMNYVCLATGIYTAGMLLQAGVRTAIRYWHMAKHNEKAA